MIVGVSPGAGTRFLSLLTSIFKPKRLKLNPLYFYSLPALLSLNVSRESFMQTLQDLRPSVPTPANRTWRLACGQVFHPLRLSAASERLPFRVGSPVVISSRVVCEIVILSYFTPPRAAQDLAWVCEHVRGFIN